MRNFSLLLIVVAITFIVCLSDQGYGNVLDRLKSKDVIWSYKYWPRFVSLKPAIIVWQTRNPLSSCTFSLFQNSSMMSQNQDQKEQSWVGFSWTLLLRYLLFSCTLLLQQRINILVRSPAVGFLTQCFCFSWWAEESGYPVAAGMLWDAGMSWTSGQLHQTDDDQH